MWASSEGMEKTKWRGSCFGAEKEEEEEEKDFAVLNGWLFTRVASSPNPVFSFVFGGNSLIFGGTSGNGRKKLLLGP